MIDRGASAAFAALVATDVTVADHAELAAAAAQSVARVQAFVDHAKVQISRRTRQLAEAGDRTSDHVLLDEGRLTSKDTAATGARDRICETLPEFESALAAGDCTGGHLDALAHHAKGLTDDERADLHEVVDELVEHAVNDPVALFDRKAKAIIRPIPRTRHLTALTTGTADPASACQEAGHRRADGADRDQGPSALVLPGRRRDRKAMSESPNPSGGERAPPGANTPPVHVRIDADIDADAERPVDDDVELEEFDAAIHDSADIPIEAPIEDVIEQHIAVPFDDDARPDAS